MKPGQKTVALSLICFLLMASSQFGSVAGSDEKDFSEIGTLQGTVWVLNHPTFSKLPHNGFVVFRRVDCKKCVVGALSNPKGEYSLYLKPGRYEVIARDGTREGETRDTLAPHQPRFVVVGPNPAITRFDIDIQLPKGLEANR